MSEEQMQLPFSDPDNVDVDQMVNNVNDGGGKGRFKQLKPDVWMQFQIVSEEGFLHGPETKKGEPRKPEQIGAWGIRIGVSPVGDDGTVADVESSLWLEAPAPCEAYPNWKPGEYWRNRTKDLFQTLFPDEHPKPPKRVKDSQPPEYVKQDGSGDTISGEEYPNVAKALQRGVLNRLVDVYFGRSTLIGETFFAPTKASGNGKYTNIEVYKCLTDAPDGIEVEFEDFTV